MARVTTFVTMLVLSVWLAGTAVAQTGTPPPGPSLNPPQNQSLSDDARQRLIIGVVVVRESCPPSNRIPRTLASNARVSATSGVTEL